MTPRNAATTPFATWLPWAAALGVLVAISIHVRDFLPIDETRYVSVAWEMWLRGDFLVPFKNGMPYSHKPPLLFWLYQLTWQVLGVNDWSPRLVAPLLSLGGMALALAIARTLWPASGAGRRVPVLLLGSLLWAVFSVAAMFDLLLAVCALLGLHGLVRAAAGRRGWWQYALAIGLGVLAKGPAILLHLLPAALLAPWWLAAAPHGWRRWYGALGLALLGGTAIALAWAIPAALAGGRDYADAIFWGQTAHRMANAFAHKRPIWWYLPVLPLLLFPWLLWPAVWRGLSRLRGQRDRGVRFVLAWLLPAFVAFSLVSGKQPHYLLPEIPAFILLAARALDEVEGLATRAWLPGVALSLLGLGLLRLPHSEFTATYFSATALPQWPAFALLLIGASLLPWRARIETQMRHLALASLAMLALLHLGPVRALAPAYDMRPFARAIAAAQAAGRPVAHVGTYDAQYQFAGRLRAPLALIDQGQITEWARTHPDGAVVAYVDPGTLPPSAAIRAHHAFFKQEVVLLDAPEAARLVAQRAVLQGP